MTTDANSVQPRVTTREDIEPSARVIWDALGRVYDPDVRRPITDLGMVKDVRLADDNTPEVDLLLTISGCPAARQIEAEVTESAARAAHADTARVDVGVMTPQQRKAFVQTVRGSKPRQIRFGPDSLTRVIAVTSGKGGVGKSSVTAGLAAQLAADGLKVGLIDADVFGFSIPGIMGLVENGVTASPTRVDELIMPPVAHGVQVISIGMFLGGADQRTTAISWRGPMLHRTIEQFLRDVWFGDLDVLLLDLPPGTGDIAISIGQLLPQSEVIVVTTPQEAAADVAVRSAVVARQTGQRVIGVIENMSAMVAPDGSVVDIFGSGGGKLVSEILSDHEHDPVPLLGSLPLSPAFRAAGDAGVPGILSEPDDPASVELRSIARTLERQGRGLGRRKLPLHLHDTSA